MVLAAVEPKSTRLSAVSVLILEMYGKKVLKKEGREVSVYDDGRLFWKMIWNSIFCGIGFGSYTSQLAQLSGQISPQYLLKSNNTTIV